MDPISDMLTSIKNAQAVQKPYVFIPFSRLKYEIVKILMKEGFVDEVRKIKRGKKGVIKVNLRHNNRENKERFEFNFKRISKPGQRIYKKAKDLRPVKRGYGIAIVSTSKGIMTDKKARKLGVGGEVFCEIW